MAITQTHIIPPIYATGFYEVKAPFTTFTISDHVYQCTAIRTFEEFADRGVNVLELAYTAYGLTENDYNVDVGDGTVIITLKDMTDTSVDEIYIPDTYIISYPDMDVANYKRLIASVDLGALPESIELGYLLTVIKQAAQDVIGVTNSKVTVHKGSASGLISMTDHNTLLARRIANKRANPTLQQQIDTTNAENRELKERMKLLVEYIKALEEKNK